MSDLDSLTEQLGKTTIPEEGVSFAGKGLAWNKAEDAKEVIDTINACPNLEYLNLEGNTLGVEAAEAIAKALEDKSKFRKALWKDMFTGRMKDEIPLALKYLSKALMKANAQLEVLELSDNASGPIGAEGIVDLIKSPSCYSLKELKLNNMGLGITGAKMLASALQDCLDNSKSAGTPLKLRVFIAGRNRLENEGSAALAKVFEEIGSLEEIQVPQNGIYFPGISALSSAFSKNRNLHTINLNDNTLNPRGAISLAESLAHLDRLKRLDIGDCLIKSKGAIPLAETLRCHLPELQEVDVSFNSIGMDGGIAIVEGLASKADFKSLKLDGNAFGKQGVEELQSLADQLGILHTMDSLSEDEGGHGEDSDEDDDYDDDGEGFDYDEDDEPYIIHNPLSQTGSSEEFFLSPKEGNNLDEIVESGVSPVIKGAISVKEFLKNPTEINFDKIQETPVSSIIQEIRSMDGASRLDELMKVIVEISGLVDLDNDLSQKKNSEKIRASEELLRNLFTLGKSDDSLGYINNSLPVYLGLIKGEDKKKQVDSRKLEKSRTVLLEHLMKGVHGSEIFPTNTKDILTALSEAKSK